MEIYEKKHYFDAVLNMLMYASAMALGIAMISVGPNALRRYPDWAWWLWLLAGAFLLITSLAMLWLRINRYLDLHVNHMPVLIIEKDCLQIYSRGKYHIIRWTEVQDFRRAPNSKDRNMCYPIYKDDSRNSCRLGLQFHRDAFFCDHLTLSEQALLDELKKHIA